MNAFEAAAVAIAADPNIGSTVLYVRTGASWSPRSIRAAVFQPIDQIEIAGGPGLTGERAQAMVPGAALPVEPKAGDRMTLADGTTLVVAEVERDIAQAGYRLRLKQPRP